MTQTRKKVKIWPQLMMVAHTIKSWGQIFTFCRVWVMA